MQGIRSLCRNRHVFLSLRWRELLVHCILQLFLTTKILLWTLKSFSKSIHYSLLKRKFIKKNTILSSCRLYSSFVSFLYCSLTATGHHTILLKKTSLLLRFTEERQVSNDIRGSIEIFVWTIPLSSQKILAVPDFQTGWIHWWLPELLWLVPLS